MTAFLYPSCLWQGVTACAIRFSKTISKPSTLYYLAFWISWRSIENMGTWKVVFCFYGDSFAFFSREPRAVYPLNPFEKCSMWEDDEAYQVNKAINLELTCFAIPTTLFLSSRILSFKSKSTQSPPFSCCWYAAQTIHQSCKEAPVRNLHILICCV